MNRVLVGVPGQSLQAMDGIPDAIPDSWVMSRRYFTALARAGAVPVMVPLLHDDEPTLRALYDRLDGLFLAGGVDVDPGMYGQEHHELCGRTDPPRDAVEVQLTRWAVADRKPVLGVCRGLHVVNVAMGGTLWQDCGAQLPGSIKHDYFPTHGYARDHLAHDVEVSADSLLARALGPGRVPVNSMHHQGIMVLGDGLQSSAVAPDGLVEAIEGNNDAFLVAVQWHPEALIEDNDDMAELFHSFAAACHAFHVRSVRQIERSEQPDSRHRA